MNRISSLMLGLCLLASGIPARFALARQGPSTADTSGLVALPDRVNQETKPGSQSAGPISPLTEGPLHEAFLSPAKDRAPKRIDQAPPTPITERPGSDIAALNAQWLKGYWEWDRDRRDFIWVTGTWRISPPGRFWVDGSWMRDERGWYRVPGFWTDRKTDRMNYRKHGPPADHPADEPGESPGPNEFYIPGQYFPDGNGVLWKPGYWANSQPGWAWVPAQWIRRPEGWTFQAGYWDRTLDDRGTLFAPVAVDPAARGTNLVYQPSARVSPQSYGLLYGAFGRPTSYYDGYPGYYYDPAGRCYGYAQYGNLGGYYGYLDYPYYGSYGYPYYTSPARPGYGYPYYGYGPRYGYYPYRNFGTALGLGLGLGIGYGVGLALLYSNGFGYYSHPGWVGWRGNQFINVNRNVNINRTINITRNGTTRTIARSLHTGNRSLALAGHRGVLPPPSSRAYANPFHNASLVHHVGPATSPTLADHGLKGSNWNSGSSTIHNTVVHRAATHPALSGTSNATFAHANAANGAALTAAHNAAAPVYTGAPFNHAGGAIANTAGSAATAGHTGVRGLLAAPAHLGGYHSAGMFAAGHMGTFGASTAGRVLIHAVRIGAHFR